MTLDQDIQMAFVGTQIIIVFVTVLFDLCYRKIQKDKNKKNSYDENEFNKLKGSLLKTLFLYCGILLFVNGFVFFMFYPLLEKVINESGYYFWTYSFTQESFFFITTMLFGFLIVSLIITGDLIRHIISIQKKYNKNTKDLEKMSNSS
jgi:hypothetical protein